ncbi:unnamed protein product [Phaedon cochleariae]|uniref:G-protein coupled receptors family 1 profile domain-containing protein n=1 Tax=Phaedon cochleariae TaxID=80249 RepID=A0A9P0GNQ6_PHACE|nr:unnamed protein product [Phaedon cochleariae]
MIDTFLGFILYSIITTIVCSFGIFGNSLSLMVLRRKELTGSIYTYLAVLAATDLSLSIIFFLSGLSRGAFYETKWATLDALVGMPVTAAISSLSVMATVAVTIDRVLFLWHPVQCTRPRFCNPRIARKLMTAGLFLAVIMNIPYCFIFEWTEEGHLKTSAFFHSSIYNCFNWIMLIVLTIIPAFILILGNGFLIMTLRKSHKISTRCNGKRIRDHTNLTIILISIIVLFLISEIPSNMVSRMKANSLLFGGIKKINFRALEITRQICTFLGAVNVTINFLFYYLFCPVFYRALIKTIKRGKKKKMQSKSKVNVFVVKGDDDRFVPDVKILEVAKLSTRSPLCLSKSKTTPSGGDTLGKKSGNSDDTEYLEIIGSLVVRKIRVYSSLDEDSFGNESTAVAIDH